jgi:parvulin-like peptidyl-prolyl isomerase
MALIINGQTISDEQIWEEMDNLKNAAADGPNPPNCCEQDEEYNGYAKDNIIARVLLSEEAKRQGIAIPDSEVEQAFTDLKTEAGGDEQFYINFNTSEEEEPAFKASMATNLLVQQVLDQAVSHLSDPTDEQIQDYYNENIEGYSTDEQVRASHILKSLDHGGDTNEIFKQLCDLRKQILQGEDFAKLADEHSDKPGDGGDLGYFASGELLPEFEAICFSMDEGDISPVFISQFGYHIAKVTGFKDAQPIPFDEIKTDVKEHCQDYQKNQAMRKLIDQLKAKATIEEVEETYEDEDTDTDHSDTETDNDDSDTTKEQNADNEFSESTT